MTETDQPLPDDSMKHLDEMSCLLYIERQLDRARAQEVSAHTQECAACRTLLRALERESRLLTRARLAQFQERARRSMHWIWTLAFGLAATGVYALYAWYVEPLQRELEKAGFGGSNLLSLLIFQGAFWKGWQPMITLVEVLALVTVAGFGLAFFRRRVRRGSALALVLAGFCAALVLQPASALASETRKGESVGVSRDETIKGDIFLFGDRVRIDGTVDGDVFLFGHNASVNGHVKGDIIAFAQILDVNGDVDGNIRAFTNTMTIRGTVAKNVLTFDDLMNLESAARVGGSLTIFVENLNLEGSLGRDIFIFAKHFTLSGKVGGGIRMKGDELTINSNAQVDGPIRYEGRREAEVATGAKLASPVEFHKWEHKPRYMQGHYYVWRVIWTAAFVLFGVVLFLLIPKFTEETIAAAEMYGASIGLGVLVIFGIPRAAIIACITVVGIPLGVLAGGFWFLMLCTAEIVVGTVVGNLILGKAHDTSGLIGRMALGFVLVRLIYTGLEQIHVIGLLAGLGIWMWGMGSISLAIYRRFQPTIAGGAPSGSYAPPLPPNTTVGGIQPA